jgi:hypothetical protein
MYSIPALRNHGSVTGSIWAKSRATWLVLSVALNVWSPAVIVMRVLLFWDAASLVSKGAAFAGADGAGLLLAADDPVSFRRPVSRRRA